MTYDYSVGHSTENNIILLEKGIKNKKIWFKQLNIHENKVNLLENSSEKFSLLACDNEFKSSENYPFSKYNMKKNQRTVDFSTSSVKKRSFSFTIYSTLFSVFYNKQLKKSIRDVCEIFEIILSCLQLFSNKICHELFE